MALGDSTTPAQYTPGRSPEGKFLPGNTLGVGNRASHLQAFKELRSVFYSSFTQERMEEVTNALFNLATGAKSEDVRLRAGMYLQDRAIGKITERVEVEGGNNTQINFNLLTADEISVLRPLLPKLLGKAQPPMLEIEAAKFDETDQAIEARLDQDQG